MLRPSPSSVAATLVALAVIALHAQPVHAQMTAAITQIGSRVAADQALPISAAECGSANVSVLVSQIPTDSAALQFFLANDMSVNCASASTRTMTGTSVPTCVHKTTINNSQQSRTVELALNSLVPNCSGQNGPLNLYVIASSTASPPSTAEAAATHIAQLKINTELPRIDTIAPSAPSGVTAGNGGRSATVSWTRLDEAIVFTAYGDASSSSGEGGACGSSRLIAGATVPADVSGLQTNSATGAGVTSLSVPFPASVPVGGRMAVAVVAEDQARNRSVISAVVCVERVETRGFWDEYQAQGGSGKSNCSVSRVAPFGSSGALVSFFGLLVLGVSLTRRAGKARALAAVFVAASFLGTSNVAFAQDASSSTIHERTRIESDERFVLEFRGGTYRPDTSNTSFNRIFGGADGPLLAIEFDAFILRIPEGLGIGIGAGAGWAEYKAKTLLSDGNSRSQAEETNLVLFPLNLMLVVRVDALSRLTGIPLVFSGKIGADFVPWLTNSGGVRDAQGISVGLRWAAQVALELAFLDRRSARSLDEEFGINQTTLFFELYGSGARGDSLPVGTSLAWAIGLGLTF